MIKYLAPLGIFVGGSLTLLVAFLFLNAVGTAGEELATASAAHASTFWGWTWVAASVKLIVFLALWAVVLFATAKSFIKAR